MDNKNIQRVTIFCITDYEQYMDINSADRREC